MDYSSQPTPEEKGQLGPPARHPPTAVGVVTPPPPPGPRRHHRTEWPGLGRLYLFTGACVGLGSLTAWLAPWEFVQGAGRGAAGAGVLVGALVLSIQLGVQARWSMWRRTRWLRSRRRAIRRASRPSA